MKYKMTYEDLEAIFDDIRSIEEDIEKAKNKLLALENKIIHSTVVEHTDKQLYVKQH